ncbi:unnamed protein product [Victoria cruziana]
MATVEDLAVSAVINILSAFAFLVAFALLRIQPINDRVYFSKWYLKGTRKSPTRSGNIVRKFVNLDFMTYVKFLNWMPEALKMSEEQIIDHAGVDSAAYLRIYLLGLRIFVPIAFLAILILVPVNLSGTTLATLSYLRKDIIYSSIDKLSISNVSSGSQRFWFHLLMAYLFTLWTCYLLYKEYDAIVRMRLQFLASQSRRVDQFTVIVRNVPSSSGRSISENVEHFFQTNHPNHYLTHQAVYNGNKFAKLVRRKERLQNWLDYYQLKFERHPDARPTARTGFLGLCGKKVDAINFYKRRVELLEKKIVTERQRILMDAKAIMPVAFVSFDSRWGAAICAQTQQSNNPTIWLTDWAPEPRDVYWQNLAIPFVSLSIRKLVIGLSVFALIFFYMIPIAFVQSLANLDGLEKVAPFLRPLIELEVIKSFLQGFLPGLALKIFLYFLPSILLVMSKVEGYIALSKLERKAAAKYYYFMLVNVFLGSIITGTAFEQLHSLIHQPPTEIPKTIGVSIPMKATFFMTYVMVDGWAGIASEILRLKSLVIYHLKNMFLVKTERERENAMDPGSLELPENLPKLQLYFLLGLVYAVVSPLLLPFIIIFFGFAFLVYRHQVSFFLAFCLYIRLDQKFKKLNYLKNGGSLPLTHARPHKHATGYKRAFRQETAVGPCHELLMSYSAVPTSIYSECNPILTEHNCKLSLTCECEISENGQVSPLKVPTWFCLTCALRMDTQHYKIQSSLPNIYCLLFSIICFSDVGASVLHIFCLMFPF